MTRIIIWSIAICVFVTKSGARQIFPDFYEQCSNELGIKADIYDEQNKTKMLCLQKCVFEKDGTINKKGILKKSEPMNFLLKSFFGNGQERIGFFNRCLSNLIPLGVVKNCWDIDKLIYCLVSNAEPFMGEGQFMLPPNMQMHQMPQIPQMPGGRLPPGWIPTPIESPGSIIG